MKILVDYFVIRARLDQEVVLFLGVAVFGLSHRTEDPGKISVRAKSGLSESEIKSGGSSPCRGRPLWALTLAELKI